MKAEPCQLSPHKLIANPELLIVDNNIIGALMMQAKMHYHVMKKLS